MRRYIVVTAAIMALIIVLSGQAAFSQTKKVSSRESKEIISKLNEILDNQKTFAQELEEIKKELAVIRVRASR